MEPARKPQTRPAGGSPPSGGALVPAPAPAGPQPAPPPVPAPAAPPEPAPPAVPSYVPAWGTPPESVRPGWAPGYAPPAGYVGGTAPGYAPGAAPAYPASPYPASPYPAAPYPASPNPASPYPASPNPASPYPASPYPPAPYPGVAYPPPPVPYAAAGAFPAPPANRAWPAQSAVGRVRMATLLAAGALTVGVLLHLLESVTGFSDVPGAQPFAAAGASTASFLLHGAELALVVAALAVGGAALPQLRESGKAMGAPKPEALRRGAALLAAATALAALGTIGAWLYYSSYQQSLPGRGVGSVPGLTQLFDHYRLSLVLAAASGAAASFLLVLGLQRVWGHLLPPDGRQAFARFARTFTLAASANVGLTIVVYYGLMVPATLDDPPAPAWAHAVLILGPAAAVASLFFLRRALSTVEGRAKQLSKRPAPPKA